MNKKIYTGNYASCKNGNLISISGDRGKLVGFMGKALPSLAPKKEFWKVWHDNIGRISEQENTKYYIEEYYKNVLSKVDFETLLFHEQNPILLCYEESHEFCHRHIVAEYLELKYGIFVPEIVITSTFEIFEKSRPDNIRRILKEII